jgi:glutathione S-transferase
LKSNKKLTSIQGLHLITEQTPNGKKVQNLLEEFKDVYGIQWTASLLDLETDEERKDWFLRLIPNGTTIYGPHLLSC